MPAKVVPVNLFLKKSAERSHFSDSFQVMVHGQDHDQLSGDHFIVCAFFLNVNLNLSVCSGLTHAFVWAACCSYILQATPTNQRATAQIIIVGIHHSFGRGCGALIGGVLVLRFGM